MDVAARDGGELAGRGPAVDVRLVEELHAVQERGERVPLAPEAARRPRGVRVALRPVWVRGDQRGAGLARGQSAPTSPRSGVTNCLSPMASAWAERSGSRWLCVSSSPGTTSIP